MIDVEIIRNLAENVMGWEVSDRVCHPRLSFCASSGRAYRIGVPGESDRLWNPLESRDDCAAVEAALPEEKRALYVSKLRHELNLAYPIGSFGQMDLFRILTATPRQRSTALFEATK